eukprot:Hpha_TRINITY_DN4511_c0_g1::TRINITY_DN4511_c0_g1_i1::g.115518::m.115518/K17606/IGBP1, TAP42; immunoglobulin-binding protein 1
MPTLGELYDQALQMHQALEESDLESASQKKQEMVKETITKFEELWNQVQSAGVFSSNEEKDDVATGDIRFFIVPYLLGDCQDKVVDTNRVRNLRRAIHCFEFFMKTCLEYGILTEKEHEELTTPLNPTDRTARVERHRRQKELQAKLAQLSEKRKHLSRRIQARLEAAEKEEEDEYLPEQGELENASRGYWFLCVRDKLGAASQQLHMMKRECEMLQQLTPEQKDAAADEYQLRMHEAKGRAPAEGAIRKVTHADAPQVISSFPNVREKILSEIFMDRNPPTMSEAEYAAIQMSKMLPSDPPPPPEGEEPNSDDDDSEERERKRKKASDWDDWKDACARDGNMGANIG